MAVLTAGQLADLRNDYQAGGAVNTDKPTLNAAEQAVEDYFENTFRAGVAAAIETAAPGVFTNAQKRRIVTAYLWRKFQRGG